jgi:hypothetical protein
MKPTSNLPVRDSGTPGWLAAVRDYVRLRNEAETEEKAEPLAALVSDAGHMARFESRVVRLAARERMRNAVPVIQQSDAKLIWAEEKDGEAAALIAMLVKRRVEQSGIFYTEQKLERERVWLVRSSSGWTVTRVEPLVAERRPRYAAAEGPGRAEALSDSMDGYSASLPPKSVSAPYLNYELLPLFNGVRAIASYRRDLAAAYADRWWNEANPAYEQFEVNCTNYVSQCIFAGNAPMNYTGRRDAGWWYKGRSGGRESWSYSWAVSNAFQRYLSESRTKALGTEIVDSPDQLQLGDVITYDWFGDGHFHHSTVVTAFDRQGMPLVNANTVPSRHRYWDYKDSYAWTEHTRYRLFHIQDHFG